MPDDRSVVVVIVSYNVRADLEACLESLVANSYDSPLEIIVVDNASSDGSPEMVRQRFSRVRCLDAGGNVGFARANNLGIRASTSAFVLLLNPDTVVPPRGLSALVEALLPHADAAAAGPRIVDDEGRAELSFGWMAGPLGELVQKAIGSLYERRVGAAVRVVERWSRQPGERGWLTGACLLLRRPDLERVGLLDERYFIYSEDVDLCVSLRAAGRTLRFVPEVELRHRRGRSAQVNPQTQALRRQSQLAYYGKHHPRLLPLLRLYLRIRGKI